jgi:hypothetical protein
VTVGPKGPMENKGLAKVLTLRADRAADAKVGDAKAVDAKAVPAAPVVTAPVAKAASFEGTTGTQQAIAAPVDGAGGSQVLARLKAQGKLTKTAATSGPTVVQTDEGKVFSGSARIESKSGLQRLVDVVRVDGDLTVHEGVLKSTDLLALQSLKSVAGRLTFEGLTSS